MYMQSCLSPWTEVWRGERLAKSGRRLQSGPHPAEREAGERNLHLGDPSGTSRGTRPREGPKN